MGMWPSHRLLYKHAHLQMVLAVTGGALLGYFYPSLGVSMRPLGEAFVRLSQMMIGPIIFTTIVVGLATMDDMKVVGRVGLRALLYFQGVTTLALLLGLSAANVLGLGIGIDAALRPLDAPAIAPYASPPRQPQDIDPLIHIIPSTTVDAFARGNTLQILLVAVLFGLAVVQYGEPGRPLVAILDQLNHCLFIVIRLIMQVAPVGAFGAMAFTIGQYGVGTLFSLGKLVAAVYLICCVFVFLVLGLIAQRAGFSLWQFLHYIQDELVLVLGTSSSAVVLPRMLGKLEHLGCARSVVGLTLPTGYSFNLAGTSIYLSMAAIFIVQATNVEFSLSQQLSLLSILLLTSKAAAAVPGSGFITLAATVSSTGVVPMEGLALLVGVDQFLTPARALTNVIGNGVATVVIARWEGALDLPRARAVLAQEIEAEADEPKKSVR